MGNVRLELRVEIEREDDGRWIADVIELPGVMAYGATVKEAVTRVSSLASQVLADRLAFCDDAGGVPWR